MRSPGPVRGPGWLKPLDRGQGLLQDSWERARLGCVRGQLLVCTGRGGLNRRNFSTRKRENRALRGCLENLPKQPWPLMRPPPQPLDSEPLISSPSTHLKSGWPTHNQQPYCLGAQAQNTRVGAYTNERRGHPQLKPQVDVHPDQQPGNPQLKPRVGTHSDQQPGCAGAQAQSPG